MEYKRFTIENYRAIQKPLEITLKNSLIALIVLNESGKSTILKAILAFDFNNDTFKNIGHTTGISNLYFTGKDIFPQITAEIETNKTEIEGILTEKYSLNYEDDNNPYVQWHKSLKTGKENKLILRLRRAFTADSKAKYEFPDFEGFDEAQADSLAKEIIAYLPWIIYNDDFAGNPPSDIPTNTGNSSQSDSYSEWREIYEMVFEKCPASEYKLSEIVNLESDKRKGLLADVSRFLSDCLTEKWKTFYSNPETEKIEVDLSFENNTFQVRIVDSLTGSPRRFKIRQRSKGFIWYYNFVMRLMFNPKADEVGVIFLLDEPGSFLHESAQKDLLVQMKGLTDDGKTVIYATHLPTLLDPQIVNINDIVIVEKTHRKENEPEYITVTNTNGFNTSAQEDYAMQPIIEALNLPDMRRVGDNQKVVIVEGICDKYAIEAFCKLEDEVVVFPSVNAESIVNNIPYFITYAVPYVAIWDNDKEGTKARKKAEAHFGEIESAKFDQLPLLGEKKRTMNSMFENIDLDMMKEELGLDHGAKFEKIMVATYQADEKTKKVIRDKLSKEAQGRLKILENIIRKRM